MRHLCRVKAYGIRIGMPRNQGGTGNDSQPPIGGFLSPSSLFHACDVSKADWSLYHFPGADWNQRRAVGTASRHSCVVVGEEQYLG